MTHQQTYAAALRLVAEIDHHLRDSRGFSGTVPSRLYRNRAGRLLRTLDEVIRAILADDLVIEGPELFAANGSGERAG